MLRGFCWFPSLFWQFPCPALHPAHTVNAVCSALTFFSSHKSKYQFPDQMWVMLACACALLPEQLVWLCPVPSEPSRSLRWLFFYNLKVKIPQKGTEMWISLAEQALLKDTGNTKTKPRMQSGFQKSTGQRHLWQFLCMARQHQHCFSGIDGCREGCWRCNPSWRG